MKNFYVRAATGLTAAAVLIAAILFSKYTYALAMLAALLGGIHEFYGISAGIRHADGGFAKKYRRISMVLCGVAFALSFLLCQRYVLADVGILLPVILAIYFVIELFSKSENPFQNIAWNLAAVIYLLMPVMLLNKLYFDKGALFTLAWLFLIWFYDSMCYIVGSLIGRHKLFERISPKKTIEGSGGGLLLSLLLAWWYPVILQFLATRYNFQPAHYTSMQWVIIAVITLIFATFGDLAESLLKRSIGIKDSGSILPGHGGFLDRFDAILLAVPFGVFSIWMVDEVSNLLFAIQLIKF
ncbi:MAG: phosphatidate cytidylyltransferase [Chitinophagales bacterium]